MHRATLSPLVLAVSIFSATLGCGARSGLPGGLANAGSEGAHGGASGQGASAAGGAAYPTGGAAGSAANLMGGAGSGAGAAGAASTVCAGERCDNGGRCVAEGASFVCDCLPGTFGDRCELHIVQIAAAYQHVCAVLSDLSVRCWGNDQSGSVRDTPTEKTFSSVAVSGNCNPGGCTSTSCGVHLDGSLQCWGTEPIAPLPVGNFARVALESNEARAICGLRFDGTLRCSLPARTEPVELPGVFERVVVDNRLVCGLRVTGEIACWDVTDAQPRPELSGSFRDLAFEVDAWALTGAGSLACLREPCAEGARAPLAGGPFRAISAAAGWAGRDLCAIVSDGSLRCTSGPVPDGRYETVSVGTGIDCGLLSDRSARCWSHRAPSLVGQALPPAGKFQAVFAGSASSCGMRGSGQVECWGDSTDYSYYDYLSHRILTQPPDTAFASMSLQGDLACGVTARSTAECWGDWRWDGRQPLPQIEFSQVFPACNCALDVHAAATCWGAERPPFPRIPLQQLACRIGQSCALSSDGALSCYPEPTAEDQPPTTRLIRLSAGLRHSCAIEAGSQALRCWGDDRRGQASPPEGRFSAVSCGEQHCCGVAEDQSVKCWGANDFGQASPRAGAFRGVAAGDRHTCGLRIDDTISCWGELLY